MVYLIRYLADFGRLLPCTFFPTGLAVIAILLGSSFSSMLCLAHLLNMSEVYLGVDEANQLNIRLDIDISREYKTRGNYYLASTNPYPLKDEKIRELLQRIFSSIEVQLNSKNRSNQITSYSAWTVDLFQFLETDKKPYLDPLSWPKIRIEAHSKKAIPESVESISARFKSDFIFEEPIALTLEKLAQKRKKTRWLIAYQSSPSLPLAEASELDDSAERTSVFVGSEFGFYLEQGIQHVIPLGLDHMLFVFILAFTFAHFRSLLLMVSAFTCAHGLTLLISVFGIVRVPSAIIEPLIAFSIAWAGWRLMTYTQGDKPSYWLIIVFGMVHGFGFAGVFTELSLPRSGALWALFGFNLGIEFAQLVVMLCGLGLFYLAICLKLSAEISRRWLGALSASFGVLWGLWRLFL